MVSSVNDYVGKFGIVNSDALKEYGVTRGQMVCICGTVLVPQDSEFDYRAKFLAGFVVNDHLIINDDDRKMFYLDPKDFTASDEKEQAKLEAIRDKDFPKLEEAPESKP